MFPDQIPDVLDLEARIEWLTSRIDDLEIKPIRPGRWCWRDAQPHVEDALWEELTGWVEWLAARYGVDELIPPCWPEHGPMIEELTALYAAWLAAYQDPDARGFDPLMWHAALRQALARMRGWNRQGCRADTHRPDPPTAIRAWNRA